MPLVSVKNKFQVTIPQELREQLPIDEGDVLEASVKNGKFVFTPKTVVDRHPVIEAAIAEGLKDIKAGRTSPKFSSVKEMKHYLKTKPA
jgi:AbrB family looped-hinge helix DNA binding protein